MKRKKVPDGVWALLSCLLWSSAFVAIKAGYASGIQPLLFAAIRFFFSGLVLIPVVRMAEGKGALKDIFRESGSFVLLIGLLQTAITYGAFYAGVGRVPASVAAIVIGVQPLLTSMLSSIIPPGEKLTFRQWGFLGAAVVGLVVLSIYRNSVAGNANGRDGIELSGILFLLAALLSSASASVLVSRSTRKLKPLALSAGQFLIGGLILVSASILFENNSEFIPDRLFFLSLTWLIIVSSVGISLWFWLLRERKIPAGALSVWKFVIPVFGALLGWTLVTGDSPDMGSVVGMILISVSILGFFRR